MNWNEWWVWATLQLKQSTSPKKDAEIILRTVLNKSQTQLLAFGETLLKDYEINKLKSLITRRISGEPIAYLVGSKEFWSLNFKVAPGTFIPRPDTECLVHNIINLLPNNYLNVLDLGTGVGTIALSIASEKPNWNVIGIDCQRKPLILAEKNKSLFNLKNVHFTYSNWFKYLTGKKFDIIISNPPYISKYDSCFTINDMNFEPKQALISNHLGLADLTIICQCSVKYLQTNGWLFLEHGWNQGKYMRNLFNKSGFVNIHTIHDCHNHERVTYGRLPRINL